MRIAVVTGASSGMGREFVFALDRDEVFDEIWVIARRRERLEALAGSCRAKIRPIPLDLRERESLRRYKEMLENERPEIAVLVNAAGCGLFGVFAEMDLDAQLDIIELNDKALTAMCHLSIPYMKKGGGLSISAPCPPGSRYPTSMFTVPPKPMCSAFPARLEWS